MFRVVGGGLLGGVSLGREESSAGKRGRGGGWAAATWRVQRERSKMNTVRPSWVVAARAPSVAVNGRGVSSWPGEDPPGRFPAPARRCPEGRSGLQWPPGQLRSRWIGCTLSCTALTCSMEASCSRTRPGGAVGSVAASHLQVPAGATSSKEAFCKAIPVFCATTRMRTVTACNGSYPVAPQMLTSVASFQPSSTLESLK